ncbi:unnamed protein product [Caenorhabditis sp. 36 PRJEB53466]|nr:unnamed protein product [Caenorhabditis sp. 36 PRJEB53466]
MKWIIFLTLGCLLAFSFLSHNSSDSDDRLTGRKTENVREKRGIKTELLKHLNKRKVKAMKVMRKFDENQRDREFVVDRKDEESMVEFAKYSGSTFESLEFRNFNASAEDVLTARMIRGARLDLRRRFFRYKERNELVLKDCYDGWFPFEEFEVPVGLVRNVIRVEITEKWEEDQCRKYERLVDVFGSFAVRVDHACNWRYWNFDASNVNFEEYNLAQREDLKHKGGVPVAYMQVKGFSKNMDIVDAWLVKPLRLDWIRTVGLNNFDYNDGCLRFQKNKIELWEKFGIVALQIIDNCPSKRKVIILNGRQPFDYVIDREDIKFNPGDVIEYARIRDFTTEDHLKKLSAWFKELRYHEVTEIGRGDVPTVPEVTITGCITAFVPFPSLDSANRDYKSAPNLRFTLPIYFYYQNTGADCQNRGSLRYLRSLLGPLAVASSRDCECEPSTSSELIWSQCVNHRGTIEITGSPSDEQLLRYRNIRRIEQGQLWIHDTKTVKNLSFLSNLEEIECRKEDAMLKEKRQYSAVRVDGENLKLESVELPKLKTAKECEKFVDVVGDSAQLPLFLSCPWMEKTLGFSSIDIQNQGKKCTASSGLGGGRRLNLVVDGSVDDVPRLTTALRNIRRIRGNVEIRNLNTAHCRLLQFVKIIDGNLTFQNNPFLRKMTLGLLSVHGQIRLMKTPRMCWELQRMRLFVDGLKRKVILTDCAYQRNAMLDAFEDREGDVHRMSDLGISYAMAFTVCYMMYSVFSNYARSLNITRWRKWTELDEHLRTDSQAYLDEDSSEEELDVLTWKRKTLMKNRLDGRDIEGEKIAAERREYRESRRGVTWKDKVKAFGKSIQRADSDSEYSGQSWLRRKQAGAKEKKNTDGMMWKKMMMAGVVDSKENEEPEWAEPLRLKPLDRQQLDDQEAAYMATLNEIVRKVAEDAVLTEKETRDAIMRHIEDRVPGQRKNVTDIEELQRLMSKAYDYVAKEHKKQWEEFVNKRKKLRKEALETIGEQKEMNLNMERAHEEEMRKGREQQKKKEEEEKRQKWKVENQQKAVEQRKQQAMEYMNKAPEVKETKAVSEDQAETNEKPIGGMFTTVAYEPVFNDDGMATAGIVDFVSSRARKYGHRTRPLTNQTWMSGIPSPKLLLNRTRWGTQAELPDIEVYWNLFL